MASSNDDPISDVVARVDEGVVRSLLLRAAEAHADVERAVRLAAANPSERVSVLRDAVDDALRTRRYLDWRQSMEWATEGETVVDELEAEAEASPSCELLEVMERSVVNLYGVLKRADDSSGAIGSLVNRIFVMHEVLAARGVADPVTLARWMVKVSFDDYGFFRVDPVRYREALGPRGLKTYRDLVAKHAAKSTRPDDFAVRYANERLAIVDGDADQLIALVGGDLTHSHQFIAIADGLVDMGRPDDALTWARRGLAESDSWQVGKLYDIVAAVLADRGDDAGVLETRLEQHRRMPSSSTYSYLKAAATPLGQTDLLAEARIVLGMRDGGALVDVLLDDGDIESAWATANADPRAVGDNRRWLALGEAIEPSRPADASDVYWQVADAMLVKADTAVYSKAARVLKKAQKAARAAGALDAFEARLAALRETHRRRPSLLAALDKAKLSGS